MILLNIITIKNEELASLKCIIQKQANLGMSTNLVGGVCACVCGCVCACMRTHTFAGGGCVWFGFWNQLLRYHRRIPTKRFFRYQIFQTLQIPARANRAAIHSQSRPASIAVDSQL
jgi:hypothetical protein